MGFSIPFYIYPQKAEVERTAPNQSNVTEPMSIESRGIECVSMERQTIGRLSTVHVNDSLEK